MQICVTWKKLSTICTYTIVLQHFAPNRIITQTMVDTNWKAGIFFVGSCWISQLIFVKSDRVINFYYLTHSESSQDSNKIFLETKCFCIPHTALLCLYRILKESSFFLQNLIRILCVSCEKYFEGTYFVRLKLRNSMPNLRLLESSQSWIINHIRHY